MNNLVVLLAALVGGPLLAIAFGAAAGHLRARRQQRGSVGTSQASELWDATQKLRAELWERIEDLEKELASVRQEATNLRHEVWALHRENQALKSENAQLKERVAMLEAQGGGA